MPSPAPLAAAPSADGLPVAASRGFETWLEEVLSCERQAVVAQVQQLLGKHLAFHHGELASQVEKQLALLGSQDLQPKDESPQTKKREDQLNSCKNRVAEQVEGIAAQQKSMTPDSEMPCAALETSKRETSISITPRPPGNTNTDAANLAPRDMSDPTLPIKKRVISPCSLLSQEDSPFFKSPVEDEQEEGPQMKQQQKLYRSNRLKHLASRGNVVQDKSSYLGRIVNSTWFELVTVSMILLNCLVMATEAQYLGYNVGYDLGYPKYSLPADVRYPWAQGPLNTMPTVFTLIFIVEWCLRIGAYKWNSVKQPMLAFDLILIVMSFAEFAAADMLGGVNPTAIRVVRVLKVFKMMKILRNISWMGSLLLLVRSIIASFSALVWAIALLTMLQTSVGLGLMQVLHTYMCDTSRDLEKRRIVFGYFGTFTRTMVTMFEISVGNWVPVCRILVEDVSEWFGLFFIVFTCSLCFAVVNVIRAVFIAETARIAASDDEIAMMRKEQNKVTLAQKLKDIFHELDESGDGMINKQEFKELISDPVMQKYLSSLDVDVNDTNMLFNIIDDGDGFIDCNEFCKGIVKVKGQAKAIDIIRVEQCVQRVEHKLDKARRQLVQFASNRG